MSTDAFNPARTVGASPTAHHGMWGGALDRLGAVVATFCILVVMAAGGTATALLVAPGSTDTYFSWTLRPEAAAAMIGGLYLASAVVFAWALTLRWRQARPLFVGVLGLTTPTFVLTVIHNEVFDFSRWQAIVWVVLFAGAPASAVLILARTRLDPAGGPPLAVWSRAVLMILAVVFAVLALAVWVDAWRVTVSRNSPVDLAGLTGTYLGAWCSFAAALAGWAAARNRWDDARLPIAAIGAVGCGLIVAFLRMLDDLRRPGIALTAAVGIVVVAIAMYLTEARKANGARTLP